jgi:radical SAM/Cys-rich protein
MELVLNAVATANCRLVDLTGGAPELNPHFQRFVAALRKRDLSVQVRTNLTVLLEPGMEGITDFLQEHQVQLVASMPCYLEENVRAQRGIGVYEKSIDAIRQLNILGYGSNPALPLNLVYNPGGPFLPPLQNGLEEDYRRELSSRFGIIFTHLLTITNMPLGRFRCELVRQSREGDYLQLLRESFNPQTVAGLMCRHQISVGWEGTLYDCDFNLSLGLQVNHGAPDHIQSFNIGDLQRRRIVTGEHCYGCTAGSGSSCQGALV